MSSPLALGAFAESLATLVVLSVTFPVGCVGFCARVFCIYHKSGGEFCLYIVFTYICVCLFLFEGPVGGNSREGVFSFLDCSVVEPGC